MISKIERGYDSTSMEQARATIDSIKDSPADQFILDLFASRIDPRSGPVCDLGCGPGQIARYFHDRGFDTVGVDLSAGMLRQARKYNPGIRFLKADMKKLPFKDGELAAIVGYLSLCHIPRWEVLAVLEELRRALRPSGLLLLAFHTGRGTFFRTESWGKPVSLKSTMFQSLELQNYLRTAGFAVDGCTEPQLGGRRGYISALKPGKDFDVVNALRKAVLAGSLRQVEALLAQGVPPDSTTDGFTGLHLAASDGRLNVLKVLLRAGASVNARCWGGMTPLHAAVQTGQLAAARRLVEAGADPSQPDGSGNTLLHMASHNGRTDIVGWLLKLQVDPHSKNNLDETPATWAFRMGFDALATMLKNAGARRL